jgi:ADP-heptose:LPS heptosyltransferase
MARAPGLGYKHPQMQSRSNRILVIRWGPIGEFVLSLPAMQRIRQAHPKARITLLTTRQFEGLARGSPYFDDVETDADVMGIGPTMALVGRIKRFRYDRVYDLQNDARTRVLFRLLWPGRPAWAGVASGASLRHRNPHRDQMHILERQADQLAAAGIWPDAPVQPGSAPPPDLSWILKKAPPPRVGASTPKPYVVLAPGGSSRPEKRWPVEQFAALANHFRARGFDIVIIGGPDESSLARQIQRTVGQARDLTGRTDFEKIAILGARAALAVGNASGPIQLIAASGAPTIALFSGASDPRLTAPRGYVTILQAVHLKDLPVAQVAQAAGTLAHQAPSP